MTCPKCQHEKTKKFGTYGPKKLQRFRCRECSATFSISQPKPLGAHLTSLDDAARVVAMLCEGMSIRAVSRLTGIHKNTILRLLLTVGAKCERLADERVRNLGTRRLECDEVWTFVGCKQKNLHPSKAGAWGDAWTWTALDADTKLIVSYAVGARSTTMAYDFMQDVASRLTGRVQLTTDANALLP
jgi:transposase-like protein